MSIAYQSWEIGSGPTVGYKAQAHPSSGDGLNFRKLRYTPAKFMQQPLPLSPPPPPQASPSQRFSAAASTSGSGGGAAAAAAAKPDAAAAAKVEACVSSSSSLVTSSISNESSDESDEKEVESAFKGPLEQMESLMTTLPMRRELSKFYVGKSRSFTSLADVKSMCMKDLAKPDNPYAKRRRHPSHRGEGVGGAESSKPKFPPPRRTTSGISKKPISSNGTTLTLAVAMSTTNQGRGLDGGRDESSAPAKRWQKSCRSFSLTDLQKA